MDKCNVKYNQEATMVIDSEYVVNIEIKKDTTIYIGDIIDTQHGYLAIRSIKEVEGKLEFEVTNVDIIKAVEL